MEGESNWIDATIEKIAHLSDFNQHVLETSIFIFMIFSNHLVLVVFTASLGTICFGHFHTGQGDNLFVSVFVTGNALSRRFVIITHFCRVVNKMAWCVLEIDDITVGNLSLKQATFYLAIYLSTNKCGASN